jgi:hypothetical protein
MEALTRFRVSQMTDVISSLVIAPLIAIMTSYPPTLPRQVIQLFDFPIVRLIGLSLVLVLAFIAPITAIVMGVGFAILMEDILKTSKIGEAFRIQPQPEGFLIKSPDEDDIPDKVGNKVAEPFNVALEHIRRAELAIQSLARPAKKLPA